MQAKCDSGVLTTFGGPAALAISLFAALLITNDWIQMFICACTSFGIAVLMAKTCSCKSGCKKCHSLCQQQGKQDMLAWALQ
jgi:hypothetical protein